METKNCYIIRSYKTIDQKEYLDFELERSTEVNVNKLVDNLKILHPNNKFVIICRTDQIVKTID